MRIVCASQRARVIPRYLRTDSTSRHAVRANAKYLIAILLSAFVVSYLLLSTGAEARNVAQVGPYAQDNVDDAAAALAAGDTDAFFEAVTEASNRLTDLVSSGDPADIQSASDFLNENMASANPGKQSTIVRVLEFAARRTDNARQIAKATGNVLDDNDAALAFAQFLPDRVLPEDEPSAGILGWVLAPNTEMDPVSWTESMRS